MPQSIQLSLALKKSLVVIFMLLLAQITNAQKKYGITAGVGKSSLFKFPVLPEDFDSYSGQGSWWAGLVTDIPIVKNSLSLFATATYNKKGYKYFRNNETGANNTLKDSSFTQSLKYADINLNLRKKFIFDEESFNNFFAGTGPVISIFTGGKEQVQTNYFANPSLGASKSNTNLPTGSGAGKYKPMCFSWNFMIGAEFGNLSVWANVNVPLADYFQDAQKAIPHKIKTIGINLAYTLFTTKEKEKKERKPKTEKHPAPVEVIDSLADRDGDGIPDVRDRCPGIKGTAKYFGCPIPDTDGDGVNDDNDKCPEVAGTPANNGCPVFVDTVKLISRDTTYYTIYFEPGKSILRTGAYETLTNIIAQLKANNKLRVIFKGHTDNAGSEAANYARSLSRASVCLEYMASFYIDRSRLSILSLGNKAPLADLNDPLLQWKNRVVEVCVYEVK